MNANAFESERKEAYQCTIPLFNTSFIGRNLRNITTTTLVIYDLARRPLDSHNSHTVEEFQTDFTVDDNTVEQRGVWVKQGRSPEIQLEDPQQMCNLLVYENN